MSHPPDNGSEATFRLVPARRMDSAGAREVEETVVCERPLSIKLNGVAVVRLTCLPERLDDLAVGFLFSEGILREAQELGAVALAGRDTVEVRAEAPPERLEGIHERLLLTSGCGKGAAVDELDQLMDCARRFDLTFRVCRDRVLELMREFQARSELFRASGGVHAAALADAGAGGGLADFAEDIGRHNAVDKVIGRAMRLRQPVRDKLLLTTGRVSQEIIAKAVRVGIPVLASRSAPTDRAIELAAAAHVALLGFVRGGRMNVYSAAFRLKD